MTNAVKSAIDYIVTADAVEEATEKDLADSIEDNLDRLFSAVNAFDVTLDGGVRYITTPYGIGCVIGTSVVSGASGTLNINPFFNSIVGVQLSQEGTTAGSTSFAISDADTLVLYRGSGSTTIHFTIYGTIDALVV
jgi:hypothetical protein